MNVTENGAQGGQGSQDFDINLAPIIDCFTVLITFLIASASFLAVGVLDTEKASESTVTTDATKPLIRIELELKRDKALKLKVSGQTELDRTIAADKGDWNLAELTGALGDLKGKYPATPNLVLSAEDDIEYLHVVRVMEAAKTKIPAVLLGGF